MRWKLIVLLSAAAALAAFCLWELLVHLMFGLVQPAWPYDRLLFASTLVPLLAAAFAGFFIYRHTSRRRKTQAAITVLLTLVLGIGSYLVGSKFWPELLAVPRTCTHPPCR